MSITLRTVRVFSQHCSAGITPEKRRKLPVQVFSGFGDRCHMAGDCQHGYLGANEMLEMGGNL
jgi:hypothetical protein